MSTRTETAGETSVSGQRQRLIGGYCGNVFKLEELVRYLPCFYDINIETALHILNVSRPVFQEARRVLGVDNEWPLNAIKQGRFKYGWIEVRYCRALAMQNEDTPKLMRKSLIEAEQEALVVRGLYMPAHMRARMEQMVFPSLPMHMLGELFRIDQARIQREQEVLQRRMHQATELWEIMHLLIDVPVKFLTRDVLGISNHTLMEARQNTVYAKRWPYPWVWGKHKEDGIPTAKEVERQRQELLEELNPQSFKARVLRDAANVVYKMKSGEKKTSTPPSGKPRAPRRPKKQEVPDASDHLFDGLDDLEIQTEVGGAAAPEPEEQAQHPWYEVLPVVDHEGNRPEVLQPEIRAEIEEEEGRSMADDMHFFDNFEFSASQEEKQYWESLGTSGDEE